MKRIYCIGDSNTFGYDPRSSYLSRYPADVRWTGRLQRGDRAVLNGGQNGLTIPAGPAIPAWEALIRSVRPLDVLVVMLGANDLLQGASAREAAGRMEALLPRLREAAPEAAPVLVAPPPMAPGAWVTDGETIRESRQYAACCRETAARLGVRFADAGEWGVELAFDGVHFTPGGHAAFARGLDSLLCEIL